MFSEKEHFVFGIAQELTQVFMNLIKNTQDAVQEKKIARPILKFSVSEEKDTIVIRVQDSAGGIEESKLDTIFDVYFSTKGKGGSGLGLYMAKEIIEKSMSGQVKVENANNGALFTISLPKGEK
jgi:signal transduction histidine kinase